MESQTLELSKTRKDLLKQERDIKETLEKSEKKAEKDAKTAQDKIEDFQGQIKYLNESMGNMKVDHDLQLEKLKKEKDQDGSTHNIGKFTTFFCEGPSFGQARALGYLTQC